LSASARPRRRRVELGLSPSALSRRVAALEDFTGKRLFTRQHQAMKLTDEGQAFYTAVAPKLDELAEAVEAQSRSRPRAAPASGRARRCSAASGCSRACPNCASLHPRLHIDIDTSPNMESRLGDTLDAAIILSGARPCASIRCGWTRTRSTPSSRGAGSRKSARARYAEAARARPS
jgi:DNA-binding transcriptional LysR family regulator